jgi:hypothetical protein
MEELIITKEELIHLFETEELKDSGRAWIMGDKEIDIIALHDIDPKFLQNITNAKFYKLISKGNK